MKALPIVMLVAAVGFAVVEFEHGRLHEAVTSNQTARAINAERPATSPVPQRRIVEIKPGILGAGARIGRYVPPGERPSGASPPAQTPGTAPSPFPVHGNTQADAQKDEQTLANADQRMYLLRIVLTAIILPLCIYVISARKKFESDDRAAAYSTIAAVVTFWLRS